MKAETESKLWWIVLVMLLAAVLFFFAHGCRHAAAVSISPHFKFPFLFVGFWSASSSTTKQESYSLQAAADNGAVNFGATYIGGSTGGASASANPAIAGGTSKTRATAAGGAANVKATGGNTGVINNQVAATGEYGTAVGAGATVQTGGITAGAGSTITVAEPTEAVAALNAALGIAAAAQNTSESVALEAMDAANGVGTSQSGTSQPAASQPASNTQYLIEFALVIAAALGLGYFVMKKAA